MPHLCGQVQWTVLRKTQKSTENGDFFKFFLQHTVLVGCHYSTPFLSPMLWLTACKTQITYLLPLASNIGPRQSLWTLSVASCLTNEVFSQGTSPLSSNAICQMHNCGNTQTLTSPLSNSSHCIRVQFVLLWHDTSHLIANEIDVVHMLGKVGLLVLPI